LKIEKGREKNGWKESVSGKGKLLKEHWRNKCNGRRPNGLPY